ncbi:phage tail tip lysozyme [Amycolatopsis sp. CA-230715]|uniref:phage tail tip lysozyme n=1 Tax=Amycolatopsis sp. CA-230715 TaxID=2745196 RepID=UPI001C0181B6|nr:phage tail tip lysozyme [Amycolatopsis sp. CA-230715]
MASAAAGAVRGSAAELIAGGSLAAPTTKRLSAGGTSYDRDAEDAGTGPGATTLKAAAAAGTAAAPPAMTMVLFAAFLAWLKSMFFAALALMANVGSMLWSFLASVVKAVLHTITAPFIAIGTFVANTVGAVFGVAVSAVVAPAAAAISGVAVGAMVVALVAAAVAGVLDTTALTEGRLDSGAHHCAADAQDRNDGGGLGVVVPANTEANAKTVYSVLKGWGMPDENIAGILGNWSQESGIDPTSVESIFTEPYTLGPRKKAAWAGNFTHVPGQAHGGIGLGQWSNGRTMLLLDYARAKNVDWFTIQTQLAFMVQGDNPGDVAVFTSMITAKQPSPSAAAYHFHGAWERSADDASRTALRARAAEMWFARMSGWKADGAVAGSVATIVGQAVTSASTAIATNSGDCGDTNSHRDTGSGGLTPKSGGMTQDEAQKMVDLFNTEGDKFLDARYGDTGGPGSCGSNHAENCVSFSTYFANKYTTYQSYPRGNGITTAGTIAHDMGKQLSPTPTPYSIGSGPSSSPAGHTLVVLGVQGDRLILGEAGYCEFMGRVRVGSAQSMAATGWRFVDLSDSLLPADKITKS